MYVDEDTTSMTRVERNAAGAVYGDGRGARGTGSEHPLAPFDGAQFRTTRSALRLDLPVPGGGAFIGAVLHVQSARYQLQQSSGKRPRTIKTCNLGGDGLSFVCAQVRWAARDWGRWWVGVEA